MNIDKLKEDIQNRFSGTNIKITEVNRRRSQIRINYRYEGKDKSEGFYEHTLDRNDVAGCIAGNILLEENNS